MKQRIKLLLTIPHLGGGGAERVIALLARHLDPERFEIHLALVTADAPGAEPPPAHVIVHRVNATRVRHAWLPLLRLVRAERPGVILSGMAHLSFLLLLLKPLLPRRTRILVRQNTTASAAASKWLTRLAYRWLYRSADSIICQSQAMADDLSISFGIPGGVLSVLANPIVQPAMQRPVLQAPPHLLYVGRLSHEKGADLLLHALAIARKTHPQIHLTILGTGLEETALHAMTTLLGLDNAVTFAGHTDPTRYFAEATLFVLPSRYEGMPNALLEAAAAGLPVVATPCCDGVVDLLRDAPGCWLTAAITPQAIAETILTALNEFQTTGNPGFEHSFLAPFELIPAIAAYATLIDETMSPRRAAMLIPTIDQIGGAERQVIELSKELARRGWRITVIALSGDGGNAAVELRMARVSFFSLGMRKAWIDPRGWLRYLIWHRREKPAILHAHLPHATWFGRLSRFLAPVPVLIGTIHTSKTGSLSHRIAYRFTHRLSSRVTCVSQSVAAAVLQARIARTAEVIPNGISLPSDLLPGAPHLASETWAQIRAQHEPAALRSATPSFRWIAVGRLAPVKGYPTLLRAFTNLPGKPTLLIAGSGPDEQKLRALATELNIASRVHFAGFQADIQALLAEADGFVLSSLWEGLPISALEASAARLPVVATSGAGTSEALIPGVTGLLVPVGDSNALASAMTRIMTMPVTERHEMGARGRRFIEETYALPNVVEQWEQLYDKLLRRRSASSQTGPINLEAVASGVSAAAPGCDVACQQMTSLEPATPSPHAQRL
jgi:glycosyltransferase involved in cell wall biosynthesis